MKSFWSAGCVTLKKKLDRDGLTERQAAVADEIDGAIDEESEELCQILVAVKKLHEHQQEKELCTVGQCESTNKNSI